MPEMWKIGFFVTLLLIAVVSAKPNLGHVRDSSDTTRRGYKYGVENPESLMWERGLIPQYEDDPDVYRDTAWFLDKIIMDEAEVVHEPVPPEVKYRFGSGKKQKCVEGVKIIPPQCQWKGMVIMKEKEEEPAEPVEVEEITLTVSAKYCNQAGMKKPKPKVVNCEE